MNPEVIRIVAGIGAILLLYYLFRLRNWWPFGNASAPRAASDEELVTSCRACERLLERDPKDHPALRACGRALYSLSDRTASAADKERLFAEAQEKYEAALALDPDNGCYAMELAAMLIRQRILFWRRRKRITSGRPRWLQRSHIGYWASGSSW